MSKRRYTVKRKMYPFASEEEGLVMKGIMYTTMKKHEEDYMAGRYVNLSDVAREATEEIYNTYPQGISSYCAKTGKKELDYLVVHKRIHNMYEEENGVISFSDEHVSKNPEVMKAYNKVFGSKTILRKSKPESSGGSSTVTTSSNGKKITITTTIDVA
jgi:hypothetical protein